jgi:hypothetical protein
LDFRKAGRNGERRSPEMTQMTIDRRCENYDFQKKQIQLEQDKIGAASVLIRRKRGMNKQITFWFSFEL